MTKEIIVVGGGAAGIMAALKAAEAGARVQLWERNQRLGRKLAITGKGRCNITNNCAIPELIENMPGNGRFLYGAFNRFDTAATMAFFAQLGVALKTERGRRVFPQSDRAAEVVDALERRLRTLRVTLQFERRADALLLNDGQVKGLRDTRGARQTADAVIIATGGLSYPATGSTGDGFRLAKQAGHSIVDCRPSLVPLETEESWPAKLSGLSLKHVELSVYQGERVVGLQFGELLFTHFGLSGPLLLRLSRAIIALPEQGRGARLRLDLKPALTPQQMDQRLQRDLAQASRKQLLNALSGLLPQALLPVALELAELDPQKPAHQISRAERGRLGALLKALPLTVKGPRPLAEAIITAGGVSTRELDPKTMASKLCGGLYFAGEVLDVDGFTGGYNLQAAWSSGFVAGQAAARQSD